MATKKQQRRREKERRHEYEEVWVDADGNELDYEPSEGEQAKSGYTKATPKSKAQPARSRSGRPMREIKPPSWQRVIRRALLLGPLLFLALSYKSHTSITARAVLAVGYTALFVPTFYWIDRMAYRRYLRMSGKPDPTAKKS